MGSDEMPWVKVDKEACTNQLSSNTIKYIYFKDREPIQPLCFGYLQVPVSLVIFQSLPVDTQSSAIYCLT